MQRDPALQRLSRDHHHALTLAAALRPGGISGQAVKLPSDSRERLAHVLRVFAQELAPHFELEERAFEKLSGGRPELDAALATMREQHATMRDLLTISDAADPSDALQRFGELLHAHVRFEERELFPLIEGEATAQELSVLSEALSA